MDHIIEAPEDVIVRTESHPDLGRVIVTAELEPGQRLRVVKFIAYGWSSVRSTPAMRDQVAGALVGARHVGWDGLIADQRSYLDSF
jgi:alpha,alpha-trehalose phosphorylase